MNEQIDMLSKQNMEFEEKERRMTKELSRTGGMRKENDHLNENLRELQRRNEGLQRELAQMGGAV